MIAALLILWTVGPVLALRFLAALMKGNTEPTP